jgi:RNA polymerase sigma-70 factor (ECF subfamily)
MFLKFSSKVKTGKKLQNYSDAELVETYKKQQDNKIIGELFARYTHLIFGVCMKYLKNEDESKDAVMEVFIELPEKIHRFEISNFKSWLYSVAKNHCLMHLRKESMETKHKIELYRDFQQEIMESAELMHHSDNENNNKVIDKLHKGIASLKREQRECVELLYLQNKSYKEVSEITGYNLKKVKSYIQNGKRNLKIYLENK